MKSLSMKNRFDSFMPSENGPSGRVHHGVALAREQRYEEALQEFLWCWHYSSDESGWHAPRVSFLLGYWGNLAEVYRLK
jgi:hypothetical protein